MVQSTRRVRLRIWGSDVRIVPGAPLGRLLPSTNPDEAIASLEVEDRYLPQLPFTVIPSSFWTLKGIHFEISAAQDAKEHYCHIMLRTDDLLSVFPGERQEIAVERIGDTLVVNESQKQKNRSTALRGRLAATTDLERRDRALIAFTILTGARDGAIASFKLRHIDIGDGRIDQDAREVRTKFSKTFITTFFPVGDKPKSYGH